MALKTKSIWPGVIIHFINNGINVILDYSSQKQNFVGKIYDEFQTFLSNNIFLIMATWIATGFIIVYLLKIADKISKKEKKEEVQLQNEIDLTERIYKLFGMDSQSSKQTPALQEKPAHGSTVWCLLRRRFANHAVYFYLGAAEVKKA